MKISITTDKILIPKKLFDAKLDKELEFDSPLPDYCPDIARLIKVDCTPFVESCEAEGDKISIKGKAVYDVLYETDYKNRLRCCSFTQDFTVSATLPRQNAENITASCVCNCEKINCRLLSPRRIIIKTLLGARTYADGEIAVNAISVTESKDTFFRRKTLGFEGIAAMHSESFRFSDSLPLAQSEKSIGEIVCGSITLQPPQISLSPGKAEIKTSALIHALCEEENNEGKYYMALKSFPVNIDYQSDAIEDFKRISVYLEPSEASFSPELDQYGESRIIKTDFSVKMTMRINEPKAYTVAEDMFEKRFDSVLSKGSVRIPNRYFSNDLSFSAEAKLPSSTPKPESLLDSSSRAYSSATERTDGGIKISGNFIVTLLADTAEGIHSFDHVVPYEHFISTDLPEGEALISAEAFPIETIATLHSDGSTTVRIIAGAKTTAFGETEESFIFEVSKRVPRETADEGMTLTYCFPEPQEDLWEIAKFYRADPEEIISANPQSFDENGKSLRTDDPILIKT